MWSVQWYPSVLTESGLEVVRSAHFPAWNSLCIQLVWWELFELNWIHLTCNPKYTKNYNGAHIKSILRVTLKCSHVLGAEWFPLQSSKLQVKPEFTETCPLADWCPDILSFQTGKDANLLNYMCRSECRLLQPSSEWCSSVGCKNWSFSSGIRVWGSFN